MGPSLESAIRAMMYGDMGEEGEPTYDQDELGRVLSIIRKKNGELITKVKPKRCQIVRESTAEDSPHLDDLEEEQSRRKEGDGRGERGREQKGEGGIGTIKARKTGTKWRQGQQRPMKEKISTEQTSVETALFVEKFLAKLDVAADADADLNRASRPAIEKVKTLQPELQKVLENVKKKVNNSRKRVSEEVTQSGKICHNCRNRRIDYLPCSTCSLEFCDRCLQNRHGEDIEVERGQNVRWVCPKCRGGCGTGCLNNCCNCSSCRKSQNLAPTGLMHKTVISQGFNNVHDYLIHMETGESAAAIAKRKQGHRWMSVDSGIVAVDMEPGMEQQKSSPGWEKKKSRSARLVGRSKRKVERKSSDRQKQHKMLSGEQTENMFPDFQTEDQVVPREQTTNGHTFPLEHIEEKWADFPRDDPTFSRQLAGCFDSYSRFV